MAAVLVGGILWGTPGAEARPRHRGAPSVEAPGGGAAPVPVSELPPEAQATYRLILAGGPFPYPKDGIVFGNRERQLPPEPRGYYHEYTVRTPGARDRGARRIVCGGAPPSRPEACYFTADHYAHFRRIENQNHP